MGPILSSLIDLQLVEYEVRKTKERLKKSKRAILKKEHSIKQHEGALNAKKEEIKLSKVQYDTLDVDIKSDEANLAKLRVGLNAAKSNKEYSAVLTQINTNKADMSKLEDRALGLMTQIDNDETVIKELEETIASEKEELLAIQTETDVLEEDIIAELGSKEERYQSALEKVNSKYRDMFVRLAERYDGEVLAEVAHVNGKRHSEQSCGGCFMSVPLEAVNALMTRDDVLTCPNCGRFLVMEMKSSTQNVIG
ncbi:MAG: hypothetical protein K9M57_08385 [Phycisphaerae bacterium]|nr:hypothetical protein [Phycisphaerae bacterium]